MMELNFFKHSDNLPAVTLKGKTYSYAELKIAVLKLSNFLLLKSIPNLKLAVVTSNRYYMDLCFLAAQYIGACLIPLSPRLPEIRRQHILKDLVVDLILDDAAVAEILLHAETKILIAPASAKPNHLFSMMMTSGSTGLSKTVGISYSNWNSFFETILKIYPMKKEEKVAQTFEPVFDPYYAIAGLAFHQGAHVYHLQDSEIYNVFQFCNKHEIQFWASVPSLVDLSLIREMNPEVNPILKRSIFTGEKLRGDIVQTWATYAPTSTIENLYGPVETTVWVSRAVVQPQSVADPLPIGRPFPDVQFKIENSVLVIEGSQVGYGYLDHSKWNHFNGRFETQDLCEMDAEGNFVFLGRSDQEIKIAGQRIDVNRLEMEIEKFLKSACILYWQSKAAHFVAVTQVEVDFTQAFDGLSEAIPAAFIPKKWICLKEWPRTDSGKWDRSQILQQALASAKVGT